MTARLESRHRAYCHEGEHEVLELSVTRQRIDPLMLQCDDCGCWCCETHWDRHECWGCKACGELVTWVPDDRDYCEGCSDEMRAAEARAEAAADLEEYGDRVRQERKEEAA